MVGSVYPLTPDRVKAIGKHYSTIRTKDLHMRDVRRSKNTTGNPLKTWVITHSFMSKTDMETLVDFFKSRRGKWDSFTFTDPTTATEHTVRFDTDMLEIKHPLYLRFSALIPLVEVL